MSEKGRTSCSCEEHEILDILVEHGAIITDSHFVYASGLHGTVYVNKDAVYPYTKAISRICEDIARSFSGDLGIEMVVAPAVGGVVLAYSVASHLQAITGKEVLWCYAEKEFVPLHKVSKDGHGCLTVGEGSEGDFRVVAEYNPDLVAGSVIGIETGKYILKRGFDKLIAGKRTLIVEDILTTGKTANKTVRAVESCDAEVIACGAIYNRGDVTAEMIGVPELHSLVDTKFKTWTDEECHHDGPCFHGVPIDVNLGKGQAYLASCKTTVICPTCGAEHDRAECCPG